MSYYFVGQQGLNSSSAGVNATYTGVVTAGFFSAGNGAAATPSIYFTADTDTGFYRVSANVLGITTGGVSAATVSAAQVFTFVNAPVVPSMQVNSLSKLASTALGELYLTRSDDATPDATHLVALALTRANGAGGAVMWTQAASEIRFGNTSYADNSTVKAFNFTATSTVRTLNLNLSGPQIQNYTGKLVQFSSTGANGASTKSDAQLLFALPMDATGGSSSIPVSQSNSVFSSTASATTRTLPTPANSYVGQIAYVVQEASHVFTVGVPAGVTVTMKTGNSLVTGADILTTKTATNFVSSGAAGDDGTSAMLVCTATDASTVATWRQFGGVGDWT